MDLAAKPLTLRRIDPDDFTVQMDGLSIGRIKLSPGAAWNPDKWTWSITVALPATGNKRNGRAVSFEAAKAAWRAAWDATLAAIPPDALEIAMKHLRRVA
jgi:hypothetical protein